MEKPEQPEPEQPKKVYSIEEISGCIPDFTGGLTLRQYLDEMEEDWLLP